LRRGETMALVGESGSGKSVTAYAIMGILDAAARITSGRIVFGGLDLTAGGRRAIDEIRGRELAIIFQNPRTALNPIRPVGMQIADILLRHGNVTTRRLPDARSKCWRKCAFPIRSGAPDPIRSSCRAACASGS
jgi:peptide/nickel transport system ATP-binding protein